MSHTLDDNCLFCKIIQKKIPAKIVYEDDDVLAFDDINPQAPVHVLLIPKWHVEGINHVHHTHDALLGKLFVAAQEVALRKHVAQNGYRLVVNTGADAQQTVFHLHVHLIGGRSLGWPPG